MRRWLSATIFDPHWHTLTVTVCGTVLRGRPLIYQVPATMGKAARLKRQRNARATTPHAAVETPRRSVFRRVRESVVAIVDAPDDWNVVGKTFVPTNPLASITIQGTGFVADDSGIVVTAKHVVQPFIDRAAVDAAGHRELQNPPKVLIAGPLVFAPDGSATTEFRLARTDHILSGDNADFALLRIGEIGPTEDFKIPPSLTLSTQLCEEGDEVGICGYPHGAQLHSDLYGGVVLRASFSRGIVSAVLPHADTPREARSIFQLDAMINPGNSGGPVFDLQSGRVVGLVITTGATQLYFKQGLLVPAPTPGSAKDPLIVSATMPFGLGRAHHIHLIGVAMETLKKTPRQRSQQRV